MSHDNDFRFLRSLLVIMRHVARKQVAFHEMTSEQFIYFQNYLNHEIQHGDQIAIANVRDQLYKVRVRLLKSNSRIIEIGKNFIKASAHFDRLPREQLLRALCVNESEWNTDQMQRFGKSILDVVTVLKLENSATVGDSFTSRPLDLCVEFATLNTLISAPWLDPDLNRKTNGSPAGATGDGQVQKPLQRSGVVL